MKINVDCLGFGDIRWIKLTNRMIDAGLALAAIGVGTAAAGSYLHRHTEGWNHANGNPEALEYFKEVQNEIYKEVEE